MNDSIARLIPSIPSLPCLGYRSDKNLIFYCGIQLHNGDFLLAGGTLVHGCTGAENCYWYLHYRKGTNRWEILETMNMARHQYASVLIDGCLFTTGGIDLSLHEYSFYNRNSTITSYVEKFSFEGGIEEKKNMPIALAYHTATMFGNYKMLVCGGQTSLGKFMVKHFLN